MAERRCLNGHVVTGSANFCPECGAQIAVSAPEVSAALSKDRRGGGALIALAVVIVLAVAFYMCGGRAILSALLQAPSYTSPSGASNVDVLSTNAYRQGSKGQFLWCDGEVKNVSSQTMQYVKAIVTWYDGSGRIVATDHAYLDPAHIAPGETCTFHVPGDYEAAIEAYIVKITCGDHTVGQTSKKSVTW